MSSSTPATAIASRALVSVASTPHSAVSSAVVALLVIDQAVSPREIWLSPSNSSRYVAYTGVYRPMKMISPVWTTMKNARPPKPANVNAKPSGKHARNVPATSSIRCRPSRAVSRDASRDATKPPAQGMPKAIPYIQAVNFS